MDYTKYKLNLREIVFGLVIYIFAAGLIAVLFYRSIWPFLLFILFIGPSVRPYKRYLIQKRKDKLIDEFSECLYSVSSSVKAGYSIENAFIEAKRDMKMFYGEKSLMASEIDIIRNGLRARNNIEDLIYDLGVRSQIEEIDLFSDVLRCAKRNGGNITEVLTETADRIRERICVDNEIKIILAEKILELRIMEAVPFFILVYLEVTSRGYFNCLYQDVKGRLFMTLCLAIYIVAVYLSEKMMRVRL